MFEGFIIWINALMYSISRIPLIMLKIMVWFFFGKVKFAVVLTEVFCMRLSFMGLVFLMVEGCLFRVFFGILNDLFIVFCWA